MSAHVCMGVHVQLCVQMLRLAPRTPTNDALSLPGSGAVTRLGRCFCILETSERGTDKGLAKNNGYKSISFVDPFLRAFRM